MNFDSVGLTELRYRLSTVLNIPFICEGVMEGEMGIYRVLARVWGTMGLRAGDERRRG